MNSRRSFLNSLGLGCAHVGVTTLLSGMSSLGLAASAAAANRSWVNASEMPYKALVCIYLAGGNDSFNMLVPRDNGPYNNYAASRTNLAIPKNNLLPISATNTGGQSFGLHPNMPKIQSLFQNGNAAFVANCGVLQQPTTLNDYNNKVGLPLGLFSHSHQTDRWQTSLPLDAQQNIGWGGRLADILQQNNANQNLSMSVSLSGTNLFQRGNNVLSYTIKNSQNGSTLINKSDNLGFYENLKRQTLDNIMDVNYQNIFKQAYSDVISGSKSNSIEFDAALANAQTVNTNFGNDSLSQDLNMVARTIAARNMLNVQNQTFFIKLKGFDNHDQNIADHGNLMRTLDNAMGSFYQALEELNVANNVTTFTISDFGRKLITNGDGSDHAWGGHTLIMGGAVDGQKIYGQYPEVYLGNPLDTGGGRYIPTTSTDEYFAELALWFGASHSDLNYILPNINNFWTPASGQMPIGFLA